MILVFLIKGVSETLKNVAKEQRGRFLSMLVGTLAASLIPTLFSSISKDRGVILAGEEQLNQVGIFIATSSFNIF